MDIDKLLKKIAKFLQFYNLHDSKKAMAVVFTQKIDDTKKLLEEVVVDKNILLFQLHTPYVWAGKDENIFFAKNDDDLLSEMLNKTKEYAKQYFENKT